MAGFREDLVRFRYDLSNAFLLAVESIRAHKLRSFLTLLGVIIGVASVVLVGAAISGLGVYAEESTAKAFGSNSFLVAQIASAGRMTRKEFAEKVRRNKQIRQEDAAYLRAVNGDTTLYSPYQQRSADVKRDNAICEDVAVIGVAAEMEEIRDITVVEGRFFTGPGGAQPRLRGGDRRRGAHHAVSGRRLARREDGQDQRPRFHRDRGARKARLGLRAQPR